MSSSADPVAQGLIKELLKEEEALLQAAFAWREARTQYQVASRKYAAVRDLATAQLGYTPYSKPLHELIGAEAFQTHSGKFPTEGRYRFIHMAPGNAVVEVLRESEEPMSLEQIVEVLQHGGFQEASPRMINAALMNTAGVVKTEEGLYEYVEAAEELPFE
jgi:hypothetical protein